MKIRTDYSWATELTGVLAAYALIVLVLCRGNPLIGFPVHHDDFSSLALDPGFYWRWPRPVSYAFIGLLAHTGITLYYLCLHLLVVAYAWLALRLVRKMLGVPTLPLLMSFLVAATALSFENLIEYSKYTGLLTSLLSGVFGVAAMLLMVSERDRAGGDAPPRWWMFPTLWLLGFLSFWSKEDFVLPTVLVAAYLALTAWRQGRRARIGWLTVAAGLAVLGALMALYDRSIPGAFTQFSSGAYKADFSPLSLGQTAVSYLLYTRITVVATILQGLTLLWNAVARTRAPWSRVLLLNALILSLVAPYACLPHHMFPYYCFNWVVWQIGASLFLLWRVSDRAPMRLALAALAVFCLMFGQRQRNSIAQWYIHLGQVNRNTVTSLRAHAKELRPYPTVVVEGAQLLGPWFATSGQFLTRQGLNHQWLVRVPKDSDYYRALVARQQTVLDQVYTVAIEDAPRPANVPVVRVADDGTSWVALPSASEPRP